MTVISILGKTLIKALSFFDALIGRREEREVIIGGPEGIFLWGTDGAIEARLMLSQKGRLPSCYMLPLDVVKTFVKAREKETLKLHFDKQLIIQTANEVLLLPSKQVAFRPQLQAQLGQIINLASFRRLLNLTSIILEEGEELILFGHKKRLGFVAQQGNILIITFMPFKAEGLKVIKMPYVTTRHLVKSLEKISERRVWCQLTTDKMWLSLSNLVLDVNLFPGDIRQLTGLKSILNQPSLCEFDLPLVNFKNIWSRFSQVAKHFGTQGQLCFKGQKIQLLITAPQGSYTAFSPIPIALKQDLSININFSVLNRVFQRLHGQNIRICLFKRGCIFKYPHLFLVIKADLM